jgi:hypothetical protein
MTTQTVEDLQRSLDRDLSWRKKEISGLRVSAMRSDGARHYLFRAGLVLLCAHWEGFLRKSVSLYVEYVFAQGLRIRELSPVIVALAFFADVKKAAEAGYPGSEDHHLALARRILLGIDAVCSAAGWEIKTEANPGTELLDRVLASIGVDRQLGMDGATWAATRLFIDEQILRDRHRVAHGEGLRLSRDEFLERAERLSLLLDHLHSTLMSAAANGGYKAAATA